MSTFFSSGSSIFPRIFKVRKGISVEFHLQFVGSVFMFYQQMEDPIVYYKHFYFLFLASNGAIWQYCRLCRHNHASLMVKESARFSHHFNVMLAKENFFCGVSLKAVEKYRDEYFCCFLSAISLLKLLFVFKQRNFIGAIF